MNPFKFFKELLRRSPLFRVIVLLLFVALVFFLVYRFTDESKGAPVIESVNPMVAVPGDVITIRGQNFGKSQSSSYVKIADSRLTASTIERWSDTEIKLKLPPNVADGLLVVVTDEGESLPSFFANRENIPTVVYADAETDYPVIEEISPESATVGQLVTITGKNFGASRSSSKVFFTANRGVKTAALSEEDLIPSEEDFIAVNENEFDYNSWSDTEIRVRVPDGADSGSLYVATENGESIAVNIDVTFPAGKKDYTSKKKYIIQTKTLVSVPKRQEATLTLYSPRPAISSSQPFVQLSDMTATPLIADDSKALIYQMSLLPTQEKNFSQNYVITVYGVRANIKPQSITRYVNTRRDLYTTFTCADSLIPCDDEKIIELKNEIVGKEKNPYRQAKALYDYICENFKLTSGREQNKSVIDFIASKRGDAYDFTLLFTALCRSCGIPSVPVSGLLIDSNSSVTIHWWQEIYFENYGFFPVDLALACGQKFTPFNSLDESPREFYFGNLDSQHIAFSRGWNQIKSSISSAKTYGLTRTYALQSVWEESNAADASYTASWPKPRLVGIE